MHSMTASFKLHELFSLSDTNNAETLFTYKPACMFTYSLQNCYN